MRIVFLGTPDFSVSCLNALINSKHEVIAVVTQPDKARNRMVVSYSPVKQCALDNNIKVLQYEKIRKEGVEDLKALNPDLMVTCAYGQIISQEILDIAKYGVINVHASLLPKYRGSAPIQWAIINGEKETGITIMQTALGVDSGDIILQKKVQIKENETAGELFDDLSKIAPSVLMEAIDLIESGKATFTKQDENEATHFPMLNKEFGHINWADNGASIINKIYGLNPWPSAYGMVDGKLFKIFAARFIESSHNKTLGLVDGDKVYCKDGYIELKEVQIEGKKRMNYDEFTRGFTLSGKVID